MATKGHSAPVLDKPRQLTHQADFSNEHSERKAFFFEKKKQKTFGPAVATVLTAHAQGNKSFLVLFFKKELLALLA